MAAYSIEVAKPAVAVLVPEQRGRPVGLREGRL